MWSVALRWRVEGCGLYVAAFKEALSPSYLLAKCALLRRTWLQRLSLIVDTVVVFLVGVAPCCPLLTQHRQLDISLYVPPPPR